NRRGTRTVFRCAVLHRLFAARVPALTSLPIHRAIYTSAPLNQASAGQAKKCLGFETEAVFERSTMQRVNDSAHKRNKNSATQRRSQRKYRGRFDFAPTRRREIERHARHVGAADTDDLYRWLLAWCWNNPKATDLRWSLQNWSVAKLGRALTDDEVDAIVDDIERKRTRRRWSADN